MRKQIERVSIYYPSKEFAMSVRDVVAKREGFYVIVSKKSEKRDAVKRHLAAIKSNKEDEAPFLISMIDKFRIMDFLISAPLVDEGYTFTCEDNDDFLIRFDPL